jgi:hypothetical protein
MAVLIWRATYGSGRGVCAASIRIPLTREDWPNGKIYKRPRMSAVCCVAARSGTVNSRRLVRCAYRDRVHPDGWGGGVGFRVVLLP